MTVTARARRPGQQARPPSLISFTASASAIYTMRAPPTTIWCGAAVMAPPTARSRCLAVVTRTWLLPVFFLLAMPVALADFDSGCAAFDRGDFQSARKEWEPLAADGHAQAQFRLGFLYTFGQGVPEDHDLALRLFRLAAEQGDADAQNNLGGMYAEGLGVAGDEVEAYMWVELAARAGHETAIRNRAFSPRG
jgi:Sel1 repeat